MRGEKKGAPNVEDGTVWGFGGLGGVGLEGGECVLVVVVGGVSPSAASRRAFRNSKNKRTQNGIFVVP